MGGQMNRSRVQLSLHTFWNKFF